MKNKRIPEVMETNTTQASPNLYQSSLTKPIAETASAPSNAVPASTYPL